MPASGKRGFGSMDEAKQREIASKGGQAAHLKGSAHEFSPEEARQAGSKGGKAAHDKGSAHEFSSEEARAAGRKGGGAGGSKGRKARPRQRIRARVLIRRSAGGGPQGRRGVQPGPQPDGLYRPRGRQTLITREETGLVSSPRFPRARRPAPGSAPPRA